MPRAVVLKEAPQGENFLERCTMELNKPKPGPLGDDEVLVEMKCRPVNPSDVMCLKGQYLEFHPGHYPATPGLEGCGVVADVGKGVRSVKAGDRVLPMLAEHGYEGEGSWQDFVVVKEGEVVKVPPEISDEYAAQAFVNPWTVVGLMETINAPTGETILVSAASSSLGKELIPYCKKLGLKTIGVVRRDSAKDELKQLGADLVLNSQTEDVCKKVMDATQGKGAYAAIDPVCGEMTKLLAHCTREKGTVLVFGNLCEGDLALSPHDLIFRDVRVEGFYLTRWVKEQHGSTAARHELAHRIFALFQEGVFKPPVGKKYGLQDFQEAVRESMHEAKGGKVLLCS